MLAVNEDPAPAEKPQSRRRNDAGQPLLLRLRDSRLLVTLREARPDAKGRPGRHLSQRQAARAIGISHGHFGEIEVGRKHPSYRTAQAIANFYGVSVEALFDSTPYKRGEAGGL